MAERLFQIGIKAVITNDEGKILLLAMGELGTPSERWDIPGGRMDDNETFEQTLARELDEEIDCEHDGTLEHVATVLTKHTVTVDEGEVGLVIVAYRTQLAPGSIITLKDYETGYEWCDMALAAERLHHKYQPEFIETLKKLK